MRLQRLAVPAVAPASLPATPERAAKVFVTLGLALALLLVVELALQARSQLLHGASIFGWADRQEMYVHDAATGLKLLRPNAVLGGHRQSIKTNRYGLRSDEIAADAPSGIFRAAVLGASSIMGAYAPRNDLTIPGLMEGLLRQQYPDQQIEVINAGVAGMTLEQQTTMLDRVLGRFALDVVIVYPGSNDFGAYCKSGEGATRSRPAPQPLLTVELPKWLMTVDMLLKNTGRWRETAARGPRFRDPSTIDLAPYEARLNALADVAAGQGAQLVLATNARAYRRDQPRALQEHLAQTARYYNPCFDVQSLHTLHERHNDAIVHVAQARRLPLVRIDRAVPGGAQYFVDASHFNDRGNRLVAGEFARTLAEAKLVH